ncbi:MAG: hypothetical protein JRN23_02405 [Nitrososphaerota archaeon]|nr:hypothetical protein [Nitrososphaerota archaeon]MDG6967522.1 hypothetical protein [Nitrososphaerota archaeon]MDG6978933.1 hypothetical protein [Nitrososphaerota archaeon]MDG6981127.1 hypothetical protein [Nitrososphaerota archaeon]MDG7020767.1 hypothetical protein [Nitrososphaerota archaeon]
MSDSEQKLYDDQIVIVDGLGITHFIPRRPSKEGAAGEKAKRRASGARGRRRSR